jgi:hypothetical protein
MRIGGGTGSGLCATVVFIISGVESSASDTRDVVTVSL